MKVMNETKGNIEYFPKWNNEDIGYDSKEEWENILLENYKKDYRYILVEDYDEAKLFLILNPKFKGLIVWEESFLMVDGVIGRGDKSPSFSNVNTFINNQEKSILKGWKAHNLGSKQKTSLSTGRKKSENWRIFVNTKCI
ncbi:MAG: hypothetical protein ACRCZ0_05090 [Cetobacterium sp.]